MASPIEVVSLEWCINDLLQKREKVSAILENITQQLHLDARIIEDSQLETFGLRRLAPLDIDQETIDLEPVFFQPLPVDSPLWSGFRAAVKNHETRGRRDEHICRWNEACRPETKDEHLCPGPTHEARYRLDWFWDALELAGPEPGFLTKNTDWRICRKPCDWEHHRLPAHQGERWPEPNEHADEGEETLRFEYDLAFCFLPTEELEDVSIWAPRVAGAAIQSHKARGDTLLRSEVHSALHLLIHQLEHGMEDYHHTIPVLIYSIHQDKTARVTQFHFNGKQLVFRQSRLLDLDSDEPTEDGYLLLRWMITWPVGETRFTVLNELVETQTIDTDEGGEKDAVPIGSRSATLGGIVKEGVSLGA